MSPDSPMKSHRAAFGFSNWRLQAPAPDCFKDLGGSYGLCQHDPAWEVLRTAEPPSVGTTLRTSAMLEASAAPDVRDDGGTWTLPPDSSVHSPHS